MQLTREVWANVDWIGSSLQNSGLSRSALSCFFSMHKGQQQFVQLEIHGAKDSARAFYPTNVTSKSQGKA